MAELKIISMDLTTLFGFFLGTMAIPLGMLFPLAQG